MRRCDDCNSDAIDLSANPVPFGEYYHLVAHVSAQIMCNNSSINSFITVTIGCNKWTGFIWQRLHFISPRSILQ